MTIYSAAARFSVPRKTLDDRVKGHVKHGPSPAPGTTLTLDQEEALVSYLFFMAYPLTRTMVKAYGWPIAKKSGNGEHFNKELVLAEHWWINFRKRHPKVTLHRAHMLERSRAEAFNPVKLYISWAFKEQTSPDLQLR